MAKYYLDTCIWRDFYEARISEHGNPLGRYAYELILKILKNKDAIIYSESVVSELKRRYENLEIENLQRKLIA
jgi:hypothetical protein